jgi:hypothetical protein
MSAVELAVETCTLKAQSPASGGSFVILPIGAGSFGSKMACQGKQVYTAIMFTVTGIVAPGITSGMEAEGAVTIVGTTTAVKVSGESPVRKGDTVTMLVVDTVYPYGSASVVVEVDDPGQTKAKAV